MFPDKKNIVENNNHNNENSNHNSLFDIIANAEAKNEIDYSKMKVEDLKSELTKLNIPFSKSAKKNDLIELIKNHSTSN